MLRINTNITEISPPTEDPLRLRPGQGGMTARGRGLNYKQESQQ